MSAAAATSGPLVKRDLPEAAAVVEQLDGDRGGVAADDPASDVERVVRAAARLAARRWAVDRESREALGTGFRERDVENVDQSVHLSSLDAPAARSLLDGFDVQALPLAAVELDDLGKRARRLEVSCTG